MLEEKFRDIAPPHVGGAAERGLEIAIAPVDRAVDQRRIGRQHLLHRFEIEMARDHKPFDPRPFNLRVVFRKIRHILWVGICGGRGRAYAGLGEQPPA